MIQQHVVRDVLYFHQRKCNSQIQQHIQQAVRSNSKSNSSQQAPQAPQAQQACHAEHMQCCSVGYIVPHADRATEGNDTIESRNPSCWKINPLMYCLDQTCITVIAGAYIANSNVSKPAKHCLDANTAERLWDESSMQIHIALSKRRISMNPAENAFVQGSTQIV